MVEAACSVLFCSLQEELVVPTLCVGAQCAEAEPLKSGPQRGGEAPPSLQVTSSALGPPALGRCKLRGIKTNAQPAPATSPCRSAHLLLMFLGEEMVGCHVSVNSHVMPLPILVHSLGHQFASELWRGWPGPMPTVTVQGNNSSPPTHPPCLPAAGVSKTGLPSNGGGGEPLACDFRHQSLPSLEA